MNRQTPTIMAFATKGSMTNEELRMRQLLSCETATFVEFDKSAKRRSFMHLLKTVFAARPDLLVMEGTGIAGGTVCLLARLMGRSRYVVSSGDAVGPFVAAHSLLAGPIFGVYERVLCRFCDGFIGWTPYLTGRAMTFGARRAMTACGWAPSALKAEEAAAARKEIRQKLGIPLESIVFGIAGALNWNRHRRYCYGLELVQAINRVTRLDVRVLIVGGGTGLERLRFVAGDRIGTSVILSGAVKMEEVPKYLAAMDVASLPQSRDGVGHFRFSTKISEFAAAGLPIVTGRLPLAYDLDDGSMWRLPGKAPWSQEYIAALAALMQRISPAELERARGLVQRKRAEFDPARQRARVSQFIRDILEETRRPAEENEELEEAETSGRGVKS